MVATVLIARGDILGAGAKKICLGVACCGGKDGWKKWSCLGGDGGGDGGGLGGKLLLSLILILLLLFKLKDIRFFFNMFNLLCILISIVFGAFFVSVFVTSFLSINFTYQRTNNSKKIGNVFKY